uniref:NADH-ubiquinone oxidoreductase chain 4 n=1 Tax=Spadella cephaloptera TaxID=52888 RepID=A0A141CKD5_9BILA|nr:NADH dehydrogenase subunit 4 [Spadella cephaloptera]
MVWRGPILIPSILPLLFVLIYLPSLSGLSKNPMIVFDCQMMTNMMVLLTFWLFQYLFLFNRIQMGSYFHLMIVILLMIVLSLFCTKNMMYFYIMFEFSLVPTMMMIFFFGYQPEKLQACSYFCLYTVTSSLPLLLSIMWNYKSMYLFSVKGIPELALSLAFMVKTPLYLLHIWLPKAHVEAPVAGSMVLAAILLKLGSYGFFLIGCQIMDSLVMSMFLYLSLIGMILSSLTCLRSNDIKHLIANSSVVHMGVVTSGVIIGSKISFMSSFFMIIAHGLISPIMFSYANSLYLNSHSRVILLNKGVMISPISSFVGFFIIMANMSVPPSLNFWSELYYVVSVMNYSAMFFPLICLSVFLGMAYNLVLYISVNHGKQIKIKMEPQIIQILVLCVAPFSCFLMVFSSSFFCLFY